MSGAMPSTGSERAGLEFGPEIGERAGILFRAWADGMQGEY